VTLDEALPAPAHDADGLLALDEALILLAVGDPEASRIVHLRYFAGLSIEEAAQALGISRAHACRQWTFARAWLLQALSGGEPA
jgi:DNA-directed RNA polymerase specialized sigma24 family protein